MTARWSDSDRLPDPPAGYVRVVGPHDGPVSGIVLALAFLAGVAMGIALEHFVLPPLVDAWVDRLRRQRR
jgi:hypothetical protein